MKSMPWFMLPSALVPGEKSAIAFHEIVRGLLSDIKLIRDGQGFSRGNNNTMRLLS